jgi:uncharacterized cupredoxin-like copper-binding protein
VLLSLGVTACGDDDSAGASSNDDVEQTDHTQHEHDHAPKAQTIEVEVPGGDAECTFDTEIQTVEEGPVELVLTNMGAEEHQASIVRLPEGTTFDDLIALAVEDPTGSKVFEAIEGFGGPNGVAPGATVSSTQYLEPGDYLLICLIPGADGIPHAMKGMVKPFAVVPKEGAEAEPKADDVAVKLMDFAFVVPEKVKAGQRISVRNDGQQIHEMAIARLEDGQTAEEALAVITGQDKASGPIEGGGGIGYVQPGRTTWITTPEEPGRYLLYCMLPDTAGEGKPHVMVGMTREITVTD